MPPHWMASRPPSTSAAPTRPPTSACPELDGRPSHQVIRFQATAAARPQPITSVVSAGVTVTIPPIVSATAAPTRKGPSRLKTVARTIACPGRAPRVATSVAIAFDASWSPFVTEKPIARATATASPASMRPTLCAPGPAYSVCTMWEVLAIVGGAALVLVALRDIFDTLFHPHGRGIVSERLIRAIWRVTRRVAGANHRVLSFAGPVSFFAVILAWSTLVILGFAVMLWPHFPNDYVVAEGAGRDGGIGDALYLSMVNLTSLGYGDIVPAATGLRYLGPLETLIGLGLLTASISWILILYRVLSDSRTLSDEIALLSETEREADVRLSQMAPQAAAATLSDITSRLITVRDDLAHSPIAYYFHPRQRRHAIPAVLPGLIEVVDDCSEAETPAELRFQAEMLRRAISRLLETVNTEFLRAPARGSAEILAAYQGDHGWSAERTPDT